MPALMEIEVEWTEHFAYWPIRSSYSKKLIWWKKYHVGEIFYDAMGRPPIKERSWKLVYTKNEYLMMLLREDVKYQHPLRNVY